MPNEPKISPGEIYFLIVIAVISDLINWIPVVNIFVTLVTLPGFQFYFRYKGLKGTASLAANIIELIPFLSVLPAITTGVIIIIVLDRRAAKKAQTAAPGGQPVPTEASQASQV